MPADDLDTDGQSMSSESRGHGDRRTKGRRDPIRALHPREVVLHLYAFDLARPVNIGIEWRHLIHRAKKEFIFLLENTHALHQFAMPRHRISHIAAAELAA